MFSYDSSKNEFLTKDAIREIAPSVFTEKADSTLNFKALRSHSNRKGY